MGEGSKMVQKFYTYFLMTPLSWSFLLHMSYFAAKQTLKLNSENRKMEKNKNW
jgi:hypothetical protein